MSPAERLRIAKAPGEDGNASRYRGGFHCHNVAVGRSALAWQHDTMMSAGVMFWWSTLCAVAGFNVLAWSLSAVALNRRRGAMTPEHHAARRRQLQLAAIYVFGCAFRSAFPVFDVPRLCLVDSWLSSVLVGRSVATCAELCFVAQWSVMLHETSRATGSGFARLVSLILVPLIAVAELCSWYSVLTTANIGHVAEESLWGVSVALMVASVVAMGARSTAARRPMLFLWCVAGAAYVTYIFRIDVPMYWSRWIADQAIGRHYLTIAQGIHDVATRRAVSYQWSDWKSEIVWMSLYFSVAVWLSIALIHAPRFEADIAQGQPRWAFLRRRFGWAAGN